MTYVWLFLAYLGVRLLFRYAFYEQGMKVSHMLKLLLEGFVFTFGVIILFTFLVNA